MVVKVRYTAQARGVVGKGCEEVELAEGESVFDLLTKLAARYGAEFRRLVLDESGRRMALPIFVNDIMVEPRLVAPLRNGDEVILLSPISGG